MPGHIITVIGGKGGVGKSVVAANLAFAFANELRNRTLLIDFDQKSSGDQSLITGLKPVKNLKDLSEFNGAIDPKSILPFLVTHPAKVSLLGMPNDAVAAQSINIEGLGKTLKQIPNIFPLTVIDGGNELTPLCLKALEFSSMIMLVTGPDLLILNQTKKMYSDLITMLYPKDLIQVVVNNMQKGHPVTPEVIAKQIGKPAFAMIPKDEQSCIIALNKAQPVMVVANSSAFAKGITDTVRGMIQKNILATLEKLNKPAPQVPKDDKGEDGKGLGREKNMWLELKERIHQGLVEEMDLKKSGNDNDPKAKLILREQTKKIVVDILGKDDTKAILKTREDWNRIVKEILDEALGLGPLEDLLADKTCSEIMVCGPHKIYYEKAGKLKLSDIVFTNNRQVINTIERIVSAVGRRIDEKTPYVDARLHDGSRVHAIIPPCALDGGTITIRKFPDKRLTYKDLVAYGSMTEPMADFLRMSVEAHRNIVVSGGTGSGKTTLINLLAGFIPSNERIITCEDSAELSLPQEHVVRLETRPPSLEGDGAIDIRCLVKQTLRMRPDRIVVGECRGGETLDMLQAMNTGHDGSMTTVHSNSPRDCIGRLETLVQYAGAGISPRAIKEMIASAVHMIVQQSRLDDGSRKVMNITEVSGIQGEVITLQDIFLFKQEGINKQNKITGKFQASGFIPKFVESLERKGYKIPRGMFTTQE